MSETAKRITGFTVLLAVVFAAAAVAGSATEPGTGDSDETDDHSGGDEMTAHAPTADAPTGDAGHGEHEEGTVATLPGLAVAQDGYRLVLDRNDLPSSGSEEVAFRIETDAGEAVTEFETEHERRMHMIMVRRDFQGFQHVHPAQRDDGSWTVDVDTSLPGAYRVFADFAVPGESLTLGADLFVAGPFEPQPLAGATASADAGDGYEVSLDSGEPHAGEAGAVAFTPGRDGEALDGVEPYLGADGHLVALREGDQAFLHTHPEGDAGGPGPIRFEVAYPTPGRYRLFLQFKHDGEVRTAAFTQVVHAGGEGSHQ